MEQVYSLVCSIYVGIKIEGGREKKNIVDIEAIEGTEL